MTPAPDAFRVCTADGCEWVMYPPADPFGDGYVYRAKVEVSAEGIAACTSATLSTTSAKEVDLAVFFAGLAADWRGWQGKRHWEALEQEMAIDAWHDGRANIMIAVTVRQPKIAYAEEAWSARVVLTLEAGEQFAAVADEIASLLAI
jgi:hypothetical protein